MPDPALLTDRALAQLATMPPFVRDDPSYQAVVYADAQAWDRVDTKVEEVRGQLQPRNATILLPAYEATLGLPVNPPGYTLAQRQQRVQTLLRRMVTEPSGLAWVAIGIFLIGPGWTYEEHIPGDGGTPPADTVRITLPYVLGSSPFLIAERIFRDITPAHIDLIFQSSDGFVLDVSQLDEGQLEP